MKQPKQQKTFTMLLNEKIYLGKVMTFDHGEKFRITKILRVETDFNDEESLITITCEGVAEQ